MSDAVRDFIGAAGVELSGVQAEAPITAVEAADQGERLNATRSGVFNTPIDTLPDAAVSMSNHYFHDFYNRIWIIPKRLEVQNPRLGADIPFEIWNAFVTPNTLTDITVSDGTGLTLDIDEGVIFKAIEIKTVNLQVTGEAPLTVDATFTFVFTDGSGEFNFVATRAFVIDNRPEQPITEVWSWLTDIMVSDDGTEQRVSLRETPRRRIAETLVYTDEALLREQLYAMFSSFGAVLLVPWFQYAVRVPGVVAEAATVLTFNTAKTDIRADNFVYVESPKGVQIVRVISVTDTDITVDAPLNASWGPRVTVTPLYSCTASNNHTMQRANVANVGKLSASFEENQYLNPFVRPGTTATYAEYDGYPLLDVRPMGTEFNEIFDTGQQVIDFDTGVRELRNRWLHTQIQKSRSFLINRVQNFAEFDYWRVFADYCKGQAKPFLVPTWAPDFEVIAPAEPSSASVTVKGTFFGLNCFPFEATKRLVITSDAGVHYAKASLFENIGGNDVIQFDPPLPDDAAWSDNQMVSLLLKVRLAKDEVSFEHVNLHSTVTLEYRTVDE